MTDISGAKHLELTVTNFGPIAEGKIELRPMTVFVGPSNTGKSYMASLIYVLHRFFGGYSETLNYHRIREGLFGRYKSIPPNEYELSESNIESLFIWLNEQIQQGDRGEQFTKSSFELPETVADLVRPFLVKFTHSNEDLDSELARCFGVEQAKNLELYPSKGAACISLQGRSLTTAGSSVNFGYKVFLTENGVTLKASIPKTMPLLVGQEIVDKPTDWRWIASHLSVKDERNSVLGRAVISNLAEEIASRNIEPLSRPAYYLPADRAGVMHAHQVVVRALIARASRSSLRPDILLPSISGVLGDFLEQLVTLASASQQESSTYDELALHLEHKLLRGAVQIERSEFVYPSFVFRPDGWNRDLPMMNASSMVSELAPVVLYLRHVVRPGDLLIIEEPEAHLYPEMQAIFTRQLVAAVQSGVRILITTHSEWILEELANLVRLSELPLDRREGIEDPEIALNPNQLGTWLFEPNEETGGSVVREISLDKEAATFPAGFGLVTESLYNRWVEISTRIQEG